MGIISANGCQTEIKKQNNHDVFLLQIDWLNDYHETCLRIVGEELQMQGKPQVLKWLKANTLSLG